MTKSDLLGKHLFLGYVEIGHDSYYLVHHDNCCTAYPNADTSAGKMVVDMDTFQAIDQFLDDTLDMHPYLASLDHGNRQLVSQ